MEKLIEEAQKFEANTKKMYKSCKFAALNIYGPREDWAAWGIFKSQKQAKDAMLMWAMAFRGKTSIRMDGNNYRVIVNVK